MKNKKKEYEEGGGGDQEEFSNGYGIFSIHYGTNNFLCLTEISYFINV